MMQTTMSCVDGMEETAVAVKDRIGTLTAMPASARIPTIQQLLLLWQPPKPVQHPSGRATLTVMMKTTWPAVSGTEGTAVTTTTPLGRHIALIAYALTLPKINTICNSVLKMYFHIYCDDCLCLETNHSTFSALVTATQTCSTPTSGRGTLIRHVLS